MRKTYAIGILSMLLLTGCKSDTDQNHESSSIRSDKSISTTTENLEKESEIETIETIEITKTEKNTEKSTQSDCMPESQGFTEHLNELPVISDNIQESSTSVNTETTVEWKEPEIQITEIVTENTIDISIPPTTTTTAKNNVIELPFVPVE